MSDVSHSGLPRARTRGRPGRTAEELTVEVEPGFDPFAGQPDLAPVPGGGPEGDDPRGTTGPARPEAADAAADTMAAAAPPAWTSDPAMDMAADRAEDPVRGDDRAPPARGAGAGSGDDHASSIPDTAMRAPGAGVVAPAPAARAAGDDAPDGAGPRSAGPGAETLPPPSAGLRPAPDLAAAAQILGVPPALARLDVTVTVEVGRRRLPLAELVAGEAGSLIALDRLVDEPVDVLVNGTPFARGEIVALGDRFAVRLLALVEPGP